MFRLMDEGQRIRDKDRDSLTKDGGQQSLATEWHAAKQALLLFGDSNDGCQVKQAAFRRHQRLPQLIDWPQGEGREFSASEIASRFSKIGRASCRERV